MKLVKNQDGQGLTEYLMLMLLICVVSIAATKSIGSTVKAKLELVRKEINEEVSVYSDKKGGGGGGKGIFPDIFSGR